jgi:hypothetical protein
LGTKPGSQWFNGGKYSEYFIFFADSLKDSQNEFLSNITGCFEKCKLAGAFFFEMI